MFWCKYFCPLGAASNIFKFWWWFAGILGIYIIIMLLGSSLHWVWPLAIICAGGFILEVWRMKKAGPGLVHITRNKETCINCNCAQKNAPRYRCGLGGKVGMWIATVRRLHYSLPEANTLQINAKHALDAGCVLTLLSVGNYSGNPWTCLLLTKRELMNRSNRQVFIRKD
jgi:hypothetical protein